MGWDREVGGCKRRSAGALKLPIGQGQDGERGEAETATPITVWTISGRHRCVSRPSAAATELMLLAACRAMTWLRPWPNEQSVPRHYSNSRRPSRAARASRHWMTAAASGGSPDLNCYEEVTQILS
jgi:hypothetical protein